MGIFDFLKRGRKKAVSPETVIYEALKNFGDRKTEPRPAEKTPEKPPEKPAYDEEARKREVSGIRDDEQLIAIISGNKDSDAVIRTAIANLNDQKLLVKVVERTWIVSNYSDAHLRSLIINTAADQLVLAAIADLERHQGTREKILARINDRAAIKEILLTGEDIRSDIVTDLIEKTRFQKDLRDIFLNARDGNVRDAALNRIHDENILREIILANPIRFTYMISRLKRRKNLQDVVEALEGIQEKDEALREKGGYVCRSCSGINEPEDGTVSCVCRHCGAENHSWKHVSNVTEYRDYAVGSTYDECTRCGARKNYKNVDYGFLE